MNIAMFVGKQCFFDIYVRMMVLINFKALSLHAPEVGSKSRIISSISDKRVLKSIWMSDAYLMSTWGMLRKYLINVFHS